MDEKVDVANELGQLDDTLAQKKSEQILKAIADSKKKRKDSLRGKVVAVYFTANEIASLEGRARQGNLTNSGLVHHAAMKFLKELDEGDGVLVPITGQSQEVSPILTERSAERLAELAKTIETDVKAGLIKSKEENEAFWAKVAAQNRGEQLEEEPKP